MNSEIRLLTVVTRAPETLGPRCRHLDGSRLRDRDVGLEYLQFDINTVLLERLDNILRGLPLVVSSGVPPQVSERVYMALDFLGTNRGSEIRFYRLVDELEQYV